MKRNKECTRQRAGISRLYFISARFRHRMFRPAVWSAPHAPAGPPRTPAVCVHSACSDTIPPDACDLHPPAEHNPLQTPRRLRLLRRPPTSGDRHLSHTHILRTARLLQTAGRPSNQHTSHDAYIRYSGKRTRSNLHPQAAKRRPRNAWNRRSFPRQSLQYRKPQSVAHGHHAGSDDAQGRHDLDRGP